MKETAYLLQAALISAWWLGLAISSSFFHAFQFAGIPPVSFWAFFAPDILLIASLSIARAYHQNRALELVILGAFAYATLYCCNATILTLSGYLPTGLMALGLGYNVFLCFNESIFRRSCAGMVRNAGKTVIQIVCIWILALAVVPYILLDAFNGLITPALDAQTVAGGLLFLAFSLLGLTSSFFLVRDGDGTPLPLDQTNELVVSGPYHYVRNPMAIAGIGQGIAVAIVFHSFPILVYSLLGAFAWHLVVRPFEEQDMLKRFGDSYQGYRQRVPCWFPRFGKNTG
ncbi:MAG: isoprenylcysteine carboxylmethyltransferase family protein [Planctomycetota bacterium]|nr:isoprenylcysteine carboxylmethyltransferase family protein [Planctomycetota bacterium]